jgi:hypothetical protein
MVASMAIATPKHVHDVAPNIGNIAIGVIIACTIGLIYSLITLKKKDNGENQVVFQQSHYSNITESIILGGTVGMSLLVAKILHMENPYWIPISCMAVMQGISTSHVWERALQRVLGTIIGLALTWVVLQLPLNVWAVCFCILVLQIIIEFLVVRNYGLAAVFISMLTVFLADPYRERNWGNWRMDVVSRKGAFPYPKANPENQDRCERDSVSAKESCQSAEVKNMSGSITKSPFWHIEIF